MSGSRRRFKRQESWRLKRVKENWRRPRGVTSRMRKEKNGWPALVKAGRGTAGSGRGRHPRGLVERMVRSESDLEGLDPKLHIVRLSATLGERRRLVLVDRVRSLNVHIANPGKEGAKPVAEEPTATEEPALTDQTAGTESSEGSSLETSESVPTGTEGLVEPVDNSEKSIEPSNEEEENS